MLKNKDRTICFCLERKTFIVTKVAKSYIGNYCDFRVINSERSNEYIGFTMIGFFFLLFLCDRRPL